MGKYLHQSMIEISSSRLFQATDKIGRKKSLIAVAVSQILSWILIVLAQNSTSILTSRFLSGLGGGALYVIIPLFTSEISDNK
jgi:MFS family permease